jgi:hypothetical protein
MKRCLLFLLLAVLPCIAKKLPGDDARKSFVSDFNKMLERDGRNAFADVQGKDHDVLQIALPNAPVRYMYEIEQAYVEPLKAEPYKSKFKELGFHVIELKSDIPSQNFPKGTWDIPIQ